MRPGVTAWSVLMVGILAVSLNTASFARSAADCAAEADRASRSAASPLGGIGRGAAKGALFGAIVGGSKSARRGAALGALGGGIREGVTKNNIYNSVYDSCMRRY